MFHDTKLSSALALSQLQTLAFNLNNDAFKLAGLIEFYKARGERILPVQYLKRLTFTRREWELATKGRRKYDGRKLLDRAPASDGCEFYGLVSEHIEIDPETKRPKTYWVIGEVDQAALDAIKARRDEAAFDVIEDRQPDQESDADRETEPSVPAGTSLPVEEQVQQAWNEGHAVGYDKGLKDGQATGCVKDADINKDTRAAAMTHPVDYVGTLGFEGAQAFLEALREQAFQARESAARAESEAHLGF